MTPSILNVNNIVATMTSREIAELTGKEHKNVLADIRDMLAALSLDTADFSAVYLSENGQYYDCFKLPERECLILVSGYSIAMRAKIIDRWQELEAEKAAPAAPATLSRMDILKLAMESEQRALEAEEQLKLAAPAIAHLEAVQSSKDDFTFQEMAHVLQEHGYRLGRNRLMDVLRRAGVLAKTSNLPMQDYRERGYFRVVESIRESASGRKHVDLTTYVTGKGHNWLTKAMDALLLKSEKIGGAA